MPRALVKRDQIEFVDGNIHLTKVGGKHHIQLIYESEGWSNAFANWWGEAKDLKKDYKVEVARFKTKKGQQREIWRLWAYQWYDTPQAQEDNAKYGTEKYLRNFKNVLKKDPKFARWWEINSDNVYNDLETNI